jgi:hypothetical protein
MPRAEYRLYFDNAPADEARAGQFSEIRVDQAIGMATAATLVFQVATDKGGVWSGQDEDFVKPFSRVRIEVKVGKGDFVPLIDGPIVAHRYELSAEPDSSKLKLVVHDDSTLLNRDEKVEVFEDKSASEIAEMLIKDCGLTPKVDSTMAAGSRLTRYVVQRGTGMQLLRQLARQHGMWVYVRPGKMPGDSVGVMAKPDLKPGDLPKILLLGSNRNICSFTVDFDALKPFKAKAASIAIADKSVLSSEAKSADLAALGDEAVHKALSKTGTVMLAHIREEQNDIDAAAHAAVDLSSWAFSAEGETTADIYEGVMTPYNVLQVSGIGGRLSGDYLVSRVMHQLDAGSYRQQFTLVRNARSAGANGGLSLIPGGLF